MKMEVTNSEMPVDLLSAIDSIPEAVSYTHLDVYKRQLLSYIASRNIDTELAKLQCVGIHYDLRRRHNFSIAFRNKSGGFEVRNSYFKGCIMNGLPTCGMTDRPSDLRKPAHSWHDTYNIHPAVLPTE